MPKYDPIKASESLDKKLARIYRSFAGKQYSHIRCLATDRSMRTIYRVFERELGKRKTRDFAFHVCDWSHDAAFIVALHLFPEKFSDAEIRAGVTNMVIHAPNHMAAAAKLSGWPVSDVFEINALDGDDGFGKPRKKKKK